MGRKLNMKAQKHKHKFRILKEIYTNDFVLYCEECMELIRVRDINKTKWKNEKQQKYI